MLDEGNDLGQALAGFEITKKKRSLATHTFGIYCHHFQRGTHHRRQIDFVDDEQIGFGDARATLADAGLDPAAPAWPFFHRVWIGQRKYLQPLLPF